MDTLKPPNWGKEVLDRWKGEAFYHEAVRIANEQRQRLGVGKVNSIERRLA